MDPIAGEDHRGNIFQHSTEVGGDNGQKQTFSHQTIVVYATNKSFIIDYVHKDSLYR